MILIFVSSSSSLITTYTHPFPFITVKREMQCIPEISIICIWASHIWVLGKVVEVEVFFSFVEAHVIPSAYHIYKIWFFVWIDYRISFPERKGVRSYEYRKHLLNGRDRTSRHIFSVRIRSFIYKAIIKANITRRMEEEGDISDSALDKFLEEECDSDGDIENDPDIQELKNYTGDLKNQMKGFGVDTEAGEALKTSKSTQKNDHSNTSKEGKEALVAELEKLLSDTKSSVQTLHRQGDKQATRNALNQAKLFKQKVSHHCELKWDS